MELNRVISALDLSALDQQIIALGNMLAPVFDMKQFYFMHIADDLTQPKEEDLYFHRLHSPDYPLDEKIKANIQKEVGLTIEPPLAYGITVEVHEGKPYKKLLHWATVKNADLVIVGRKEESSGSGITAKRLAHNLSSSILIVPERLAPAIQKIVVPVDFSDQSIKALQAAVRVAKKLTQEVEVVALHVIETVSLDQYPGNFGYLEHMEKMRTSSKASYEKMLRDHAIQYEGLQVVYLEDPILSISSQIKGYLDETPSDLVVMGATGHTHFENFLYGSVAEQLVDRYTASPILVLR